MSDLVKEYDYRYDARPDHDLELPGEDDYSREEDVAVAKGITSRREHDQVFIKQLMDWDEVVVFPSNEVYVTPNRNKLFLDLLRGKVITMGFDKLPDEAKDILRKKDCTCGRIKVRISLEGYRR